MNDKIELVAGQPAALPEAYEPLRVELALDAQSLQREVHYAGTISPK